jgi:uncharacterized protein
MIDNSKEHQRIMDFISAQTVLTLCVQTDDGPWCAPCFYAFDAETMAVIFRSSPETRHVRNLSTGSAVAGSILPDRPVAGRLRGIQFTGRIWQPEGAALERLAGIYHARHPLARTVAGLQWFIALQSVKMTDNTLGFGKKLLWEARTGNDTADFALNT